MRRDKWKSAYDDKCAELLGMGYKMATSRLERKWLFHLLKQAGKIKCYHCPFDVESENDMSIEHMEIWGGNRAKGIEPCVEKFWDLDNLAVSHKRCNTSAANAGTGKYKYMGVNYVCDPRKKIPQPRGRASICIRGIPWTLGEYKDPKDAALAYDLAIMFFMNGIGKLNFEQNREVYVKFIVEKDIKHESFFRVRNKQIKKAIFELKELLNDDCKRAEV
jgi:hypothetical protein